jgi:hypothetical protein
MKFTDRTCTTDITLLDKDGFDQSHLCLNGPAEYDEHGACIVDDLGDLFEWFTDVVNHAGNFRDCTTYNGLELYLDGELVAEEKEGER